MKEGGGVSLLDVQKLEEASDNGDVSRQYFDRGGDAIWRNE